MHKTPGTGVADDIDSTSYSGAEHSCTRTEKMIGKDVFVRLSVWSNKEDDMSLGNKPHDVMGLDALFPQNRFS